MTFTLSCIKFLYRCSSQFTVTFYMLEMKIQTSISSIRILRANYNRKLKVHIQ